MLLHKAVADSRLSKAEAENGRITNKFVVADFVLRPA